LLITRQFAWLGSSSRSKTSHFLSLEITLRHHTREDSSRRVIGPLQRLHNTQHSLQKDIYASGAIRTRITSKRAAADPNTGQRDHQNRQSLDLTF